ncbi:hypothetical protein [Actinophytocola gossypii]|uniref:Uncharacterized protein n=1 Tax=Actinophytocola gossypii TaxID=2812003 RepID=A0ABT2JCH8_9PSEU|nr:hypothetical protein [Actinophytocola gossypii]MCT2585570.1 hypothetical protein [Actinophytocola gossypii]
MATAAPSRRRLAALPVLTVLATAVSTLVSPNGDVAYGPSAPVTVTVAES